MVSCLPFLYSKYILEVFSSFIQKMSNIVPEGPDLCQIYWINVRTMNLNGDHLHNFYLEDHCTLTTCLQFSWCLPSLVSCS